MLFLRIVLYCSDDKFERGQWLYNILHEKLVFGTLITIMMEPYMELLISAYLNIKNPLDTTHGEVIGVLTGWFGGISACFILPGVYLYVVLQPT